MKTKTYNSFWKAMGQVSKQDGLLVLKDWPTFAEIKDEEQEWRVTKEIKNED